MNCSIWEWTVAFETNYKILEYITEWQKSAWRPTKTSNSFIIRGWSWHDMNTAIKQQILDKTTRCIPTAADKRYGFAVNCGVWIIDVLRLTTSWEEKQVSREEAAKTPETSAIQEVDHVTNGMARGVKSPKLQPCPNIYDIFVC